MQTPVTVEVPVQVVVSILPHVRMQIDRHQFGERQWWESTDGRKIELAEKHRQLANLWGLLAIALEEALQAQRQTEGGEKA